MTDSSSLERSLQDIADQAKATSPDIAAIVTRVHQRERRRRMRRSSVASVSLVVAILSVVLAVTHFSINAGPVPSAQQPSARAGTSQAAQDKRTFDPRHQQRGPETASLGQPYPYDLWIHCGLRYAYFAGKSWELVAQPAPTPSMPAGEARLAIPGYMTMTGSSTLRFEAPGFLDQPILFSLMTTSAPGCA